MQGTRDLWGQWNLGTGRLGEPERDGEGERLMKVELRVKKIVKDSGLVGSVRTISARGRDREFGVLQWEFWVSDVASRKEGARRWDWRNSGER